MDLSLFHIDFNPSQTKNNFDFDLIQFVIDHGNDDFVPNNK